MGRYAFVLFVTCAFASKTNDLPTLEYSFHHHLLCLIQLSLLYPLLIHQPPYFDVPFIMDKLPPELLQRICSSFSGSPNELKPIRLVSKRFAAAAALYLIPRVFLFKHQDSYAEARAIAGHPIFCKHVTTLIMDLTPLKQFGFVDWLRTRDDFQESHYNYNGRDTERLIDAQKKTWMSHEQLRYEQAQTGTKQAILDTVSAIFQACPNLTNIVFALTAGKHSADEKKYRFFKAIKPQKNSWNEKERRSRGDPVLWDVMRPIEQRKTGLSSLTITNTAMKCAKYADHGSTTVFNTLKHLRIGFRYRTCNPKTKFGVDPQEILSAAHHLQTFWIDAAIWIDDAYDVDDDLRSICSADFKDLILSGVVVSEDALVEFLLRYSHSLQRLSFGEIYLTSGNWESVARRISCQMSVLRGVQIININSRGTEEEDWFTPSYHRAIESFILKGGEIPEPTTLADYPEEEFDDSWDEDTANRKIEDGLWKDYDEVNYYFRYE